VCTAAVVLVQSHCHGDLLVLSIVMLARLWLFPKFIGVSQWHSVYLVENAIITGGCGSSTDSSDLLHRNCRQKYGTGSQIVRLAN